MLSYVALFQTLASSVTNAVTILNAPNATNELHSITVNCTIHPNSTADQCVVMAMDDGGVNRTGLMLQTLIYTYIHNVHIHV